ncbi:MAG: helix-turn-helix transcriptional regulator [Actinomycetota bacterium]|nr:helix-turn-helix transcriptional regulator [Actinomycetota bacterium]
MAKSIHSDPYRALLDLVRSLRMDAGLSQTELARRLARSQTFVSKVELGERRLDVEELRQVCDALEVDLLDVVARWLDQIRSKRPRRRP